MVNTWEASQEPVMETEACGKLLGRTAEINPPIFSSSFPFFAVREMLLRYPHPAGVSQPERRGALFVRPFRRQRKESAI